MKEHVCHQFLSPKDCHLNVKHTVEPQYKFTFYFNLLAMNYKVLEFLMIIVIFRINLDFLQNPEEAVKYVRETQSIEGAKMVAK